MSQSLRTPLFWTVVGWGFLMALALLELPAGAEQAARAMVLSLLLFTWATFAVRLTHGVLARLAQRWREQLVIRQQTLPLFNNVALIVVITLAVYVFIHIWNIDMTAWLASAGIVGIAVGFAAKDTLANLFAGIFILADAPYKIGEYIVLDNAQRGKVTNIGLRSTRILTRDDVEVTIPNSIIGNSSVINESGGPQTGSDRDE